MEGRLLLIVLSLWIWRRTSAGREDSVDSTVHVYYGELCLFDEAFHSTDRRIAKSATMNAVLFVLLFASVLFAQECSFRVSADL